MNQVYTPQCPSRPNRLESTKNMFCIFFLETSPLKINRSPGFRKSLSPGYNKESVNVTVWTDFTTLVTSFRNTPHFFLQIVFQNFFQKSLEGCFSHPELQLGNRGPQSINVFLDVLKIEMDYTETCFRTNKSGLIYCCFRLFNVLLSNLTS